MGLAEITKIVFLMGKGNNDDLPKDVTNVGGAHPFV